MSFDGVQDFERLKSISSREAAVSPATPSLSTPANEGGNDKFCLLRDSTVKENEFERCSQRKSGRGGAESNLGWQSAGRLALVVAEHNQYM
jgi:hypothetical protein